MKRLRVISVSAFAALIFTANVFSQDSDTAYIPFTVNVDADIAARQGDVVISKSAVGGVECTLGIYLGTTSITHGAARGQANDPLLISNTHGNITLNLPTQSYPSAQVSLYAVNGKRILHQKTGAAASAINITRANVAPGVYTLSAKGTSGNAFAANLIHNGGKLNIRIMTRNIETSPRLNKYASANDDDAWKITVSAIAPEYEDSTYSLIPIRGTENPPQNITLRKKYVEPPMSPRDSILDYIDKNWASYGYKSKPTKYVALTFDDGPCSQTGSLLAALENKKVKATFFVIGQNVRGNNSQAQAIHNAGHELANHSDGYNGLGGNTATSTISASLTAASTAIKNITGQNVTLFRAPNVEYGNNLTSVCQQQGLAIIGVSIWSNDYNGLTSTQITDNVLNSNALSDGGIINCHEANTAPNTIAAIPSMIDGLREKGYWICTVSELATIKNRALAAGALYDRIQ